MVRGLILTCNIPTQLANSAMPRDPRITATDHLQAIEADDTFYGILVSQKIFDLLELRSAALSNEEVPLMNRLPVAVDKKLMFFRNEKIVTKEEWLARATAK